MESNMYSTGPPDGLTKLAATVDRVIAQDLDRLGEAALADHARELRRLIDRLGAAGADQGEVAPSTADWLSARLDISSAAANSWVRIARARYPGP
jgi:hypothetical protein